MFELLVSTCADPVATRVLRVPGSLTLDDLHLCIAVAFGRGQSPPHHYVFALGERRFLLLDTLAVDPDMEDDRVADAEFVHLDELDLREGATLQYVYDFAASHKHEVAVRAVRGACGRDLRPRCLEAVGTAPDSGVAPDVAAIDQALGAIFAALARGEA